MAFQSPAVGGMERAMERRGRASHQITPFQIRPSVWALFFEKTLHRPLDPKAKTQGSKSQGPNSHLRPKSQAPSCQAAKLGLSKDSPWDLGSCVHALASAHCRALCFEYP